MDVRCNRLKTLTATLCLASIPALPLAAVAAYQETGRAGDPASWRSAEYQQDWGLERMQASQAYAAGITGAGVRIGALDSGFDAAHPEASPGRFHPVTATGQHLDGTPFTVSGVLNGANDSHGTHVTGTMGAARDGVGMHGVAFEAQVYVGNTNKNDKFLFGIDPDPRYFKAAYDALVDAGARAINNSWGSQPKDVSYQTLEGLRAAYAQHYQQHTWLDAAGDVARRGVINVFSAGNSGYANASVRSALPYFQPELEGHWLAVSGLDKNNQQKYNQCGIAKYWCLATPGAAITSTVPGGGYATYNGTSMAAPHATGALALVMQRYPYLNNQQALEVLLTTARQLDGAPTQGPSERVGWGVPDLGRALHGPGQLLGEFNVNLERGQGDSWSNGISDQALAQRQAEDAAERQAWQQTLKARGWEQGLGAGASQQDRSDYALGMARDAAAAQRVYQGSLVKAGAGWLELSGDSSYRGPTRVDGGLLVVNGSLQSAVTVNAAGTLGGSGRVAALTASAGGVVAPGNSIGTLNVAGNLDLQPGSTYRVELSPTASDRLLVGGQARVAGANLSLVAEARPNLLAAGPVASLVGRQFDILQAAGGVDGRFAQVQPGYLFLGTVLDYSANGVQLGLARSAATFDSVGATANQRASGGAVERLGPGNPVYESLLLSTSLDQARDGLRQLAGEIYPALDSMLLSQGAVLREALGERVQADALQANTTSSETGASQLWLKGLGSWGRIEGVQGTESYTSSLGGLLLGLDRDLDAQTRAGLAAGYSDSSLGMGASHSRATVDSYHLGGYVRHDIDQLRLSLGGSYSWHRAEVRRDLAYAEVSGRQRARVDARSQQLFAEAAYRLALPAVQLEPFANLTYQHLQRDGFHEKGDAAALHAGDEQRDAWLSTLGLRGRQQWQLGPQQDLQLAASIGWQHRLSGTQDSEHLAFAGSDQAFRVHTAPALRDAALVGLQARLGLARDLDLSLDYQGRLASREQQHGAGLSLQWRF
ncbi:MULTISPECIES: autotransporter serine protease [unclassified Pseudomonas]|uniref:autotransporter serine peptidase EprS n=1 Tax=unclassified Pseudomonas TaxID=196821 RepID=UPI002098399B|nr:MULTISPECIES: autotransporter serine protease [unclassified Pseudomonas]MCO7520480.1 autotransporter domain-containing protein [Pseudomonas sp. 1]MCO7540645.1 autotransporter domain-containing protein [Pseudomonas sp. VA159-2]